MTKTEKTREVYCTSYCNHGHDLRAKGVARKAKVGGFIQIAA